MQCHSCVCAFLGMKSPRNGIILVLEGVVFHYSRLKCLLGQLLYILTFNFNNFVLKIQNYRIKKKKKEKR